MNRDIISKLHIVNCVLSVINLILLIIVLF